MNKDKEKYIYTEMVKYIVSDEEVFPFIEDMGNGLFSVTCGKYNFTTGIEGVNELYNQIEAEIEEDGIGEA